MAKAKGKSQLKVTILYGLPASGKTLFANQLARIPKVDFDSIIKSFGPNKFAVMAALTKEVARKISGDHIIIDGLVTTNQQLRDIIDSLTADFSRYQLVFELVYWREDRDSCLHNDKNRRATSSEVSIKNLPYEKPDLSMFPELSQKRVQAMRVVRKSSSIAWISALLEKLEYSEWQIEQVTDSLEIKSSSWCLGGTWGSWDGSSGTVSADSPIEFDEFDRLLEVACPNIGFLTYKKLKRECCTLVTREEGDYYGGSTTNSRHICDVQKLYDILVEMKILDS
jgi:predicted kinase